LVLGWWCCERHARKVLSELVASGLAVGRWSAAGSWWRAAAAKRLGGRDAGFVP
jgi:hypothetical protein